MEAMRAKAPAGGVRGKVVQWAKGKALQRSKSIENEFVASYHTGLLTCASYVVALRCHGDGLLPTSWCSRT